MCNLYSLTTNQKAIRRLFSVECDLTGNLSPLPGIFPNYRAPILRMGDAGRELVMMCWGLSPLPDGALRIVARGDRQDGLDPSAARASTPL